MAHGKLVTFEGTEGGGKSTQIRALADRLQQQGHRVRMLREPGGTHVGEEIRTILKHTQGKMTCETELLLVNASRAQLVREVIQPALAAGEIILVDRYYDSTLAYQGYARGLDLKLVRHAIDVAIAGARPDLTLLLYVSIEVSERRRQLREQPGTKPPNDRFEAEGRAFFARVEEGFLALAREEPDRIKIIDAAQSIEEVKAAVWREVEAVMVRV